MKIVKGDTVYLRAGRDAANAKTPEARRAVRGRVIRTLPHEGKVVVEGLNMVTKHQKPGRTSAAGQVQQGGRIKMEASLPVSRVMLVCPSCDKPTRVGMRVVEESDGRNTVLQGQKPKAKRERICKQCGQIIDRPTDSRML